MNKDTMIELLTGNKMPIIGLGTWQLKDETAATVLRALDEGYRMIDTSGDYGVQPEIGKAIEASGLDRSHYYIVTKVEENEDAYQATVRNLQELRLDFADLVLIHRPPSSDVGIELWEGLIRAKKDGLTKDIGVSNYDESEIDELIEATDETPAVNQIEWSPFGYSVSMLDYCNNNAIVIQAYSPLTRAERLDDEVLLMIADKHNKTPAQILVRWNLQLGTVPLPKANTIEHMLENLHVFDFELTAEDMVRLKSLNEAYSALGTLPYV